MARSARARVYPGAVRLRVLCATCLAILAVAGCGDSDDSADIKTKADFVTAADKICVERDEASTKLAAVQTDADLARLSGQLAEIYDKAITELKAVELPPGDARAGAEKYVRATVALSRPVEQMEAASTKLQAAVKTKQAGALKEAGEELQRAVNAVQGLGEVADQAARDYGMRNCGQAATSNPVS
jgi:multidrug resistance efflux pump